MKQSSIEFLMEKLFDPSSMVNEQLEWFEQAKAMHKEEIENAFISGDDSDCLQEQEERMFAQVYYNETFKTK